jgi:hypothetical protein
MNRFLLLVLILFYYSVNVLNAQQTPPPKKESQLPFSARHDSRLKQVTEVDHRDPQQRNCFTVESEEMIRKRYPGRKSTQQFEEALANQIGRARMMNSVLTDEVVYRIPTIVHVVHGGEPVGAGTNISEAQVLSQFEALNEDFRRLGPGYNEHPDGADIRIEFVPVTVDPSGKPLSEPGIDRVFGYRAFFEYLPIEFELKPNTIWDPERYFNIWVLNFGGSMSNVLGYAQFPGMSGLEGLPDDFGPDTDGVVIGYRYFGRTGVVQAPFNMGRTTTHEVGHWLGLRHIWGDGDCSATDYCEDTPPADGPNQSCIFRDSCPFDEKPDMIENYMDYSDDPCMSVFTNDQKARIRTVLEVSPRRRSLVGCQQSTLVVAGANVSGNNQWFDYTSETESVVTISSVEQTAMDTKLVLYSTCDGPVIVSNDNVYGSSQSEISIRMLAGESIKIFWKGDGSEESFNWTLTEAPIQEGAACDVAMDALSGDNYLPATDLKTFWYTYTPAGDHQKITINANGKNITAYGGSCDALGIAEQGNSAITVYDVSSDETLVVAIETNGGDFTWSLTSANVDAGQSCESAIAAVQGINTVPSAPYWYTYTAPFIGTITISSEGHASIGTHAKIFNGCDGTLLADNSGSGEQTRITLNVNEGDVIKILWDDVFSAESFQWELSGGALGNGATCGTAIVANEGVNTTGAAPQWFSYTTTKNTNLRISAVGLSEVNTQLVIKRSCDGPIVADNDDYADSNTYSAQSELILYDVNAGETFYLLWSEKWSYEGFDWLIEEIDPSPGDVCSNPKPAVLGVNEVMIDPDAYYNYDIYWTSYVVPASAEGKKLVLTSTAQEVVYILENNCESLSVLAEGYRRTQLLDPPVGSTLIIGWTLNQREDFEWSLLIKDIMRGDVCENPIVAGQGINNCLYAPAWFEYTMQTDGSLMISSEGLTDLNTVLFVLDGCGSDEHIIYGNDNTDTTVQSEARISGLSQGDRLLIYWSPYYDYEAFDWKLEELPRETGDICSDPAVANYGLNYTPYATKYFTYTVPTDGNVKISSLGFTNRDTHLFIYDQCDGTLLASSDNTFVVEEFVEYFQSEVLLENMTAGQTLLIKWAGTWSFKGFHWSITDGGHQQGDTCEDPLPAAEGLNNAWKASPSWFTFTMPSASSLTISALGYTETDTYLEIYDGCNGTLLAENDDMFDGQSFVHLPELAEGQTVLIHWRRLPAGANTFDWKLIVGQPDPGVFCQFPTDAIIGTNATPAYTGEYYTFRFTMPGDNKKLTVKRKPGSEMDQYIYRSVDIVSDCDFTTWYGNGVDGVEVAGLPQGEEVLILWNMVMGEKPAFEWDLAVEDLEPGDDCAHAIPVTPGTITAERLQRWYTYTMPRTGNVRISNVGLTEINSYLEVFDACGGNLIAESDDAYNEEKDQYTLQSEVLLENVEEGQTIIVRWRYTLTPNLDIGEGMDWTLSLEGIANNVPVFENITVPMPVGLTNGQVLTTFAAHDDDDDALFYTITAGNDENLVTVEEATGKLKVANAELLEEINEVNLTVSVTDNFATTSAIVELKRVITSLPDAEGNVLMLYPNPANKKITIQLPAGREAQEVMLLDVNGRIIKIFGGNQKQFDVDNVEPGIYFLKVNSHGTYYSVRVAIVR